MFVKKISDNLYVAPGLVDLHTHFREPGFEYKEDIATGAAAAAAGGIMACCVMPNTKPVADTPEIIELINKKAKQAAFAAQAPINILPIAAVTAGQQGKKLNDFKALKAAGAVAVSDDGMPIVDDNVMRGAMLLAKETGLLLISHCEPETEMAERDIRLAAETGARLHIAHVSLAATVEAIRRAKAQGVNVTAETCPHYFSLTKDEVARQGANACMNPPLATQEDVKAVIEGLRDGTIDAIATDHAPHSIQEKALPPGEAPNGIIGLETSFAVALTYLYHTGILSLDDIARLMSINPARIIGLGAKQLPTIQFDPDEEWAVDPTQFKSKSRNTPYAGFKLKGRIKQTKLKK